jgi:hypothetical protein
MKAWKFLDANGRAVFSGHRWPLPGTAGPGPWVEVGHAEACRSGVHACRLSDLAWWINEELWEVELWGEVVERDHKLVSPRGRLVRRLDDWAGAIARDLAGHCAWRARDLAVGVLAGEGLEEETERLSGPTGLEHLQTTGLALAGALGELTPGGLAAALAGDAAYFALQGAPFQAPYVAACAAGHAARAASDRGSFRNGFAAERAAQSHWIARRLGLPG